MRKRKEQDEHEKDYESPGDIISTKVYEKSILTTIQCKEWTTVVIVVIIVTQNKKIVSLEGEGTSLWQDKEEKTQEEVMEDEQGFQERRKHHLMTKTRTQRIHFMEEWTVFSVTERQESDLLPCLCLSLSLTFLPEKVACLACLITCISLIAIVIISSFLSSLVIVSWLISSRLLPWQQQQLHRVYRK